LVGIKARGYSKRLQRVLVDFGAESSFARSVARLQEHYGISVPTSSVRKETLAHGCRIVSIPDTKNVKAASQLITQMDGSMIPVMQPGRGEDKRQGKTLFWREVKLCCARSKGQVQAYYAATMGSAETAGWVWRELTQACGLKPKTQVHAVGELIKRFVVLPQWAAETLALWTLHTYAYHLRDVSTYIGVESPEKRCGKTTMRVPNPPSLT
jgi:hypothetical protein